MRDHGLPRARLLAEAALVAAFVRIALRVLPLPRVVSLLAPQRARSSSPSFDVASCVAAAGTASACVAHPTCLYRALVAFALLARRGAPVVFHLGAARSAGFEAHAWISVAGGAVGGDPARWPDLWQRPALHLAGD